MAARKKNMTKDAVLSPPVSEAGDDGAEVAEERTEVVRYAAAIDVAKGFGMVCTRVPGSRPDRRRQKVWQAGATYGEVVALMDHLRCEGIQRLVLESTSVIRGRQRASATAGHGPGLPVSPSVADGLSGELPAGGKSATKLIPLRPLVDAAFALPVTDAYVRAPPAVTPSLIFVTPDNGRGFHPGLGDAPAAQPVGQRVELAAGRAERAAFLLPAARRGVAGYPDGDLDLGLGDVQPGDPVGEQRLVLDVLHRWLLR
jgi:hypothetical protein